MQPSFYKRGLSYFGAVTVGGLLTAGTLAVSVFSVGSGEFQTLTAGVANVTSTANIEALNVTSTADVGGLLTPAAGFVSQASSTVVGTLTATGAVASGASITGTGLRVGAGATLTTMLGTFIDVDFPAVLSGACSSTDMYVPGVLADPINPMIVEVGYSPTFRSYATSTNIYGFASSTPDYVVVNVCQPEVTVTDPMGDPPIQPFSVLVKQFTL